jgi:hypothetical protein
MQSPPLVGREEVEEVKEAGRLERLRRAAQSLGDWQA